MSGPGYPYGAPPPQYGGYGAPPYGAAPYAPPGDKPAKPQQPGGYADPYAAAGPYGEKPPKNQQPGGYADPYAAAPYGEKPPKTQQPGGYSDPYAAAAPYGEKPPKTQQPGGYPPSAPPAAGYADPYAAAPYGDKPSKPQYADPYSGGGYEKPSKAQYADPYSGGGYEKPGKPHQGGGYGDPYGSGSGGGGYEKPSKMQQGGGYQGGYGGAPYGGSPFAALVPSAFPPGTDPNVVACFQAADHDGSGFIDDKELQGALSNYNQSFSLRTVHLLMYLFTSSNLRKIGPKEFTSVFYSLQSWRGIFDRADRDRSGKIEVSELRDALLSLGFAVSPVVLDLLVSKFDKSGGKIKAIEYDAFIECCLTVKGLTEKFKEKDVGFRGSATFTYEEFMLTVLPFLIA